MVAMNVWPTDAADGSVANEARWRKMARHYGDTGIVRGIGGELKPTNVGVNMTVASGAAWVDGHYCELLSDQVLTVTPGSGIVVVRFDPAANTAEVVYRAGVSTPTQSPTGIYEMVLAEPYGGGFQDVRFGVWQDLKSPGLLTAGWVPFSADFGGGWPGFRRVGDRVEMRGLVKGGSIGGAVTMFVLPAAFRPSGDSYFATEANGALGLIRVSAGSGGVAPTVGSNVYFSLNSSWSVTR